MVYRFANNKTLKFVSTHFSSPRQIKFKKYKFKVLLSIGYTKTTSRGYPVNEMSMFPTFFFFPEIGLTLAILYMFSIALTNFIDCAPLNNYDK